MGWAVVQCQPMAESRVRLGLMRMAYETYAPQIRTPQRVQRLFPGYVFVAIAERWYPLYSTAGVIRVLMAGDRPALLPDAVIAEIKARQDRYGFVRMPVRRPRRGQLMRVVAGSFLGQVGLYEGASGEDRERILLDLLGRKVPVNLPTQHLEEITTAR